MFFGAPFDPLGNFFNQPQPLSGQNNPSSCPFKYRLGVDSAVLHVSPKCHVAHVSTCAMSRRLTGPPQRLVLTALVFGVSQASSPCRPSSSALLAQVPRHPATRNQIRAKRPFQYEECGSLYWFSRCTRARYHALSVCCYATAMHPVVPPARILLRVCCALSGTEGRYAALAGGRGSWEGRDYSFDRSAALSAYAQ
eukprot:609886-Rhodomonas_salina.4